MVCTQHGIRWDLIRFIQVRFFLRHLHWYSHDEQDFVTGADLVISHPFMFAGFRLYWWHAKKKFAPSKMINGPHWQDAPSFILKMYAWWQ